MLFPQYFLLSIARQEAFFPKNKSRERIGVAALFEHINDELITHSCALEIISLLWGEYGHRELASNVRFSDWIKSITGETFIPATISGWQSIAEILLGQKLLIAAWEDRDLAWVTPGDLGQQEYMPLGYKLAHNCSTPILQRLCLQFHGEDLRSLREHLTKKGHDLKTENMSPSVFWAEALLHFFPTRSVPVVGFFIPMLSDDKLTAA